MRYRRRAMQSNNRSGNGDFWIEILKKVLETLLVSGKFSNNQQASGQNQVNRNYQGNNKKRARDAEDIANKDTEEDLVDYGTLSNAPDTSRNTDKKDNVQAVEEVKDKCKAEVCERILNEYEEVLARTNKKEVAELIREIYHGLVVTVTLTSGQVISGEVIGLYNNILILRNDDKFNYIKGESITSFS